MELKLFIRKGISFVIMFAVIFGAGFVLNTADVSAASHTHSYKLVKTKAATCKKAGYKKYKCKTCGKEKTTTIAKKDHAWDHYEMRDASCTKDGFNRYKCTKCGTKKTVTIKKKGHNYKSYKKVAATCQKTGTNYVKCTRCGNKTTKTLKKTSHKYVYNKTVHATYEKAGYKQYKCKYCTLTKKETIPNIKTTLKNVNSGDSVFLEKITLNNDIFEPELEDFGKRYDEAMSLYYAIKDGIEDDFILVFNDDTEMMEFDTKFDYKVFGNKYDIFYGGQMNAHGWHKYDLEDLRKQMEQAEVANEYAYNACVSAGVKGLMSEKEAIVLINNWICDHISYCINEKLYYEAFQLGKGQCHAYAQMFSEMCKVCGIECKYVQGYAMGVPHAWNKVKLGDTWYWVDTTWNDDSEYRTDYLLSKTLWGSHKEW